MKPPLDAEPIPSPQSADGLPPQSNHLAATEQPSQPTPPLDQSPVAMERPHPLTGVAHGWIALLAIGFFLGREFIDNGINPLTLLDSKNPLSLFDPKAWFGLGIVALWLVLTLVGGIIQWRTTRFVADQTEFRIERTFLNKESSRISYTKLQAVDIERPLAARLLGLASVKIDVGGNGGETLKFLSLQRAEALRDHLLAQMRSLTPAVADDAAAGVAGQGPTASASAPGQAQTILRVSTLTLIKGTLLSNALPLLIIWVAIMSLNLVFDPKPAVTVFFASALALVGYLWKQVAGNWNFTISRLPNGLQIRNGLLSQTSRSLKPDRIQAVAIQQDLLQRLFGIYRMRVTVLGMSSLETDEEKTGDLVLPYGNWDDVLQVVGTIWPGINLAAIEAHGQPARAKWLTPLSFKLHSWGTDSQTIVSYHGWLRHSIELVPHARVQAVCIRQGPLQRRLRLASVKICTTNGPVEARLYHLDEATAREFLDAEVARAQQARTSNAGYLIAPPAPTAPAASPLVETGQPQAGEGNNPSPDDLATTPASIPESTTH